MNVVATKAPRANKRKASSNVALSGGHCKDEGRHAMNRPKKVQATSTLSTRPSKSVDIRENGADVSGQPISFVCKMVLKYIDDMEQSERGYPIVLRANALESSLGLPRRRIYDVFHILQAIGLLGKGPQLFPPIRGHHYYGEDAVVPTIASVKASAVVLVHKKGERRSKPTYHAPSKLRVVPPVPNVNEQAVPNGTKLPALWQATQKLLKCIFARGGSISLREIYTLDDDNDGSSSKSRRYYDVLAVLSACNILKFNTDSKFDRAKVALMNPALLTALSTPMSAFTVFELMRLENLSTIAHVPSPHNPKATSDKKPRLWAKQKASQRQLIVHTDTPSAHAASCDGNMRECQDSVSFAGLLDTSLFDNEPFGAFYPTTTGPDDCAADEPHRPVNKNGLRFLLSPCKHMHDHDEFSFALFPLDCDNMDDFTDL
ncbi:hypothetical protein H257_16068 [Aphanomyces astaci]|uniref:E2F/DP family winged-helix DNA-binding domain-containing protein n=1 Tax=Aphanomyces astaci TaxID=112090 RepID=W4FJZ2_APHAT|nr:hypothetical protein H257_16068 [Aphanomyces astaci]ETV67832.1 hypothetical protein H257_16068 [Aphanomyces astaci]RQM22498.1 hypothetical protein B5M09_000924 [Aphanomyces astaci]|eukprot:XP_009842690.1 hypothetical protein H257_16068 [Aphanomyces astaci]